MRQLVARLGNGYFRYAMDNGAEVVVAVTVDRARRATSPSTLPARPRRSPIISTPLPVVRALRCSMCCARCSTTRYR